jgi:hypothetical protein
MIIGKNQSRRGFFQEVFLQQKLNNFYGYVIVGIIAIAFAYLLVAKPMLGFTAIGAVIGLALVSTCVLSAEMGLYINLIYAFFSNHFSRFLFRSEEFPVGVVTDVFVIATFLGLFIRRENLKAAFGFFMKSSVMIWVVVLLFFLFIEMFNPGGGTFQGWSQGFRRFLISVILLFIAFQVFSSYQKVINYVKVLFVACVLTAFYGCIQQWHGLFPFEVNWVTADENRFGLYFINGNFRKFSTMSDPTAFGVVMASCAILFIILALHQKRPLYKWTLLGGSLLMLLAMSYSGTRTANVMVAAGMCIYILLTINRKQTKVFAVFSVLVYLFLMNVPIYSNYHLNRFRSSFSASSDGSYLVREKNREYIQPLIHSHPIGYGIHTVGGGGVKYAPGHFLAGFPPDSGYLKKAIETGWIGLAIVCMLYFVIMRTAIRAYFRSRYKRHKMILAGTTAALFSFFVAEFPQEAIGQTTDIVVYYPLIAIALSLRYIEASKEPEEETESPDQPQMHG